jgi:hypothetical protein
VKMSVWVSAFNSFEYISESEIAVSFNNYLFNFLRNCYMGLAVVSFYIRTNNTKELHFLHFLANTCYFLLFKNNCHPTGHVSFSISFLCNNKVNNVLILTTLSLWIVSYIFLDHIDFRLVSTLESNCLD